MHNGDCIRVAYCRSPNGVRVAHRGAVVPLGMGLRGKDHWLAVRQAFADDAASRIEDAAKLTAHERIMLGLRMGALSRSASEPVDESEHAALIIHRRWRALQERRRAAGA